jgi:4-amino-4-deoxy-L-arabinose transferase-like glycosyltransferase
VWSAALPLWQGTDEAAHFGLAQYIAEAGRLPGRVQRYLSDEIVLSNELSDAARLPFDPTQRQTFGPGTTGLREDEVAALDPALRTSFERQAVNQVMLVPPLYGLGGSLVYRLFYEQGIIERSSAVRLYALGISTVSLVFVYLLARELVGTGSSPGEASRSGMGSCPSAHLVPATLTLLVAFQPQFTYSVAGGTSDVLAMLWFTVLAYGMVRAARRGMTVALAVAMGVSLGLGLLTKPHLFMVGPALAVLFVYLVWRARGRLGRVVLYAAIVAGLALLLWAGWALRSTRLHGNPFYDTLWASGWVEVQDPQYAYPLVPYLWDYIRSLVGGLFASYWGVVGYLDTPLPALVYRLLQVLTLLSITGLGMRAWNAWRERGARQACVPCAEGFPWLLLALLSLTPVAYFAWFNYDIWRTAGIGWPLMGRHYAGPLAAQMALWLWGLAAWVPARARPLSHLLLRISVVALNQVYLFAYLLPRYYR